MHAMDGHRMATRRARGARGLALGSALLAGVLVAAGCGGSDGDGSTAGTVASAQGTRSTATSSSAAGVTTTVKTATGASTTTTAPAPVTLTLDKTFWYSGFEVTLSGGTFTADPKAKAPKRGGDLLLTGTATNLTDGTLNFGYIALQSDLSVETKGDTFELEPSSKEVPEGGKAKVELKASVEDFDEKDAVLVFGGTKVNAARVPLGSGAVVTVKPSKVPLTATGATPSGMRLTLSSAEILPFSPRAGGGDGQQAKAGELYLKLNARERYEGTVNNAIFSPSLTRPDGLSEAAVAEVGFGVVDPGQEKNGFYVFTIPAKTAGNYVFRFTGSSNQDKGEVAFTLP